MPTLEGAGGPLVYLKALIRWLLVDCSAENSSSSLSL